MCALPFQGEKELGEFAFAEGPHRRGMERMIIEMVSMRQSDHAPLLRLVAAGSAESRRFVLRLPAKGKSNAG